MTTPPLKIAIAGLGAWGPGFCNWPELAQILERPTATNPDNGPPPKPVIIPANERRRAPLPVKLAVETAWQATQATTLDPSELACVFASGLGDTDITDHMCQTLATGTMQLSPTKFHNSVHNAAAGYWTISTSCTRPANSIAGFAQTASLALMEAASQCVCENIPVLAVFFDAPATSRLAELLANKFAFAAAMVLVPVEHSAAMHSLAHVEISVDTGTGNWNNLHNPSLAKLYQTNPAARILTVLERITELDLTQELLNLPLGIDTSITVRVEHR